VTERQSRRNTAALLVIHTAAVTAQLPARSAVTERQSRRLRVQSFAMTEISCRTTDAAAHVFLRNQRGASCYRAAAHRDDAQTLPWHTTLFAGGW
jgi:hypothetical protein